mmetsp:Transcript_55810/g.120619  ORF Transcript_55810/g.120619 Transcript_55810/m.120619 type:complete len:203 (+) Transcript_55810:1338-1946(+)
MRFISASFPARRARWSAGSVAVRIPTPDIETLPARTRSGGVAGNAAGRAFARGAAAPSWPAPERSSSRSSGSRPGERSSNSLAMRSALSRCSCGMELTSNLVVCTSDPCVASSSWTGLSRLFGDGMSAAVTSRNSLKGIMSVSCTSPLFLESLGSICADFRMIVWSPSVAQAWKRPSYLSLFRILTVTFWPTRLVRKKICRS